MGYVMGRMTYNAINDTGKFIFGGALAIPLLICAVILFWWPIVLGVTAVVVLVWAMSYTNPDLKKEKVVSKPEVHRGYTTRVDDIVWPHDHDVK